MSEHKTYKIEFICWEHISHTHAGKSKISGGHRKSGRAEKHGQKPTKTNKKKLYERKKKQTKAEQSGPKEKLQQLRKITNLN